MNRFSNFSSYVPTYGVFVILFTIVLIFCPLGERVSCHIISLIIFIARSFDHFQLLTERWRLQSLLFQR